MNTGMLTQIFRKKSIIKFVNCCNNKIGSNNHTLFSICLLGCVSEKFSTKVIQSKSLDFQVHRLVWMDLEMTGLDIEKDKILEIACLVTDSNLNIIEEGPEIVINQPIDVLDNMNDWCKNQHGKTGLIEQSRNSTTNIEDAENIVLNFLTKHVSEKMSPLAGNTVYMDKLFLKKFMPRVDNYLHYRIIDVSSIKELCRMWNAEIYKSTPNKVLSHRSLSDIRESVEELKYYRENFFQL